MALRFYFDRRAEQDRGPARPVICLVVDEIVGIHSRMRFRDVDASVRGVVAPSVRKDYFFVGVGVAVASTLARKRAGGLFN